MKVKIKNKYEEYKEREGTKTIGESMTDQSQREETDIYACLKKYGVTSLVNQTKAKEFLYLDNTNREMTLDEAVRMRNEMKDYFDQLPARVRKTFGDKADLFIEKYKKGEFTDFIATGVLSEEMAEQLTPTVTLPEVQQPTVQQPEIIQPTQGTTTTTTTTGGMTNV